MRLLLDTHILLVLVAGGAARLPAGAASLLSDRDNEQHLSAASLWEIAIKHRLGKLRLAPSLDVLLELLDGMGIAIIAINEPTPSPRSSPSRRPAIRSIGSFSRNVRSRD
jgi:PIN domain nuclease of toxin-antitoxin system